MDIKVKLLYIFLDLVCPLTLGYLCRCRQTWGEKFFRNMIDFNIFLLYPVLSILSFWVLHLTAELMWLPVFGVVLGIIPGVAAYAGLKRKYHDPLERGSYLLSAILSNFGTLGGLCAFILFGEIGYAYVQLTVVPQNFVLFLFCFPLAQYYYQQSLQGANYKVDPVQIFFNRNQLPVLGLLLGIVLNYCALPRPEFLGRIFDPLVHLGAWTALMPIGFSIELAEMKRYYRHILDLVPIKFVLTPILSYLMARLVIRDETTIHTLIVIASTPTAINAVVTAKIHNLNVNVAMAAFVVTTALFVLVVFPVLAYLLLPTSAGFPAIGGN